MKVLALFAAIFALANADCYMHNPRGANNRLNGNGGNRANNNRMCDTQNNGAGGYCWGPSMSYYEGSELSIEWTNQHSCGGEGKTHCNIVLQYMCTDRDVEESPDNRNPPKTIRDGTTTDSIPDDITTYNQKTGGAYTYGMHEDYFYYQACKARSRNKGLFIADRNVGNSARSTRQNNGGGRSGFECPEERDYWPYWHPTPWRDIAVLTSDTSLCSYYEDHSFNDDDIEHGWCETPTGSFSEHNQQELCEKSGHVWKLQEGHGISPPDCVEAPWNRDNHLGNGIDPDSMGHTNNYNWTLPTSGDNLDCIDTNSCDCVLRIRYNISTDEIDGFHEGDDQYLGSDAMLDSAYNGEKSPVKEDPLVTLDEMVALKLEINTNQYGRVFQDRSHVFHIRPTPAAMVGSIYNLNVRGKRGNIVQVYPSVEYDFVPETLKVAWGDYVHIQWTGCDTNPAGRAGQGRDKTDRSNMVQIKSPNHNMPVTEEMFEEGEVDPMFEDKELRNLMAFLAQPWEQCNKNDPANDNDPNNCYFLNMAPAHFDAGLIKFNNTGTYHYMSTRNNNFTNRSHKATLIVGLHLEVGEIILVTIASAIVCAAAAFGGMFAYAKANPSTSIADKMSRVPFFGSKL